MLNEKALEEVLFWLAGSVQGRKLEILQSVFPYLLIGWIASLMMAGSKYIDDGRRRRERTWTTNNFNEIIRVTYYCTVVWWFSCGCWPNWIYWNYYSAFCEISCWS